ncbi:MAG: cell wall-active antibiotics response protein [Candidatus Aminicenantes bacterium]|nr:cell wall-active antibiotics response protein [Candidatus Aminicenantes bacterium]
MEKRGKDYFDARVIVALFVIALGVLFLLKNLGVPIAFDLWELWPVALILVGLSHISRSRDTGQSLGGWIILGIGVLFLLSNLDIIPFGFFEFWPVVLILVGILILKNAFWGFKKTPGSQDFINLSFVLGGGDFKFNTKNLKGGKITSIMGGGTIDLREADIQEDEVVIDAFCLMGGIEIRVPTTWEVNMQATPLLGGMDNKTSFHAANDKDSRTGKSRKKLTIKGIAIMGGMEIKN